MPIFTIRTKEDSSPSPSPSPEDLSVPTIQSKKPRGRPPKGKVWCETTHDWIGDGTKRISGASPSTKPCGRPRKGTVWCETTCDWIGDGTKTSPAPSVSTKPRGRPPKGKVWCERNQWISKPKISLVKRVGSNGKIKYVIKLVTTPKECTTKTAKECSTKTAKECTTKKPKECSTKTAKECSTKTPKECSTKKPKECSTKLNKFIHKQLMAGKVTGVEDALREGGSLAYFNFDGICSAAENGKIGIFRMIFEKLDYTRLIDKALCTDLCETAEEEGHDTLAIYLRSKRENLMDTIENENLDGLDDYV